MPNDGRFWPVPGKQLLLPDILRVEYLHSPFSAIDSQPSDLDLLFSARLKSLITLLCLFLAQLLTDHHVVF